MPDSRAYQLIIVGTGPGGYVAAIRAAQLGLRTAVVEKDELGGTCLNWGCIPTKAWIVTAHLLEQIKRAKEYGIEVGEPRVRWDWLIERKTKVVRQLTGGVKTLLSGRGVDIHRGTARLTSANKMVVTAGDQKTELTADSIMLATGAYAWMPPGFSLDGSRVITSKEALDLAEQPRRIAILGGGVVGSEFACFFAAVGSKVTLIEMLPRLVPAEDDEISQALEREMKKQKIDLCLGTKLENRRDNPDGSMTLTLGGGKTVDVDTVLVATGRRPWSSDMGLEAAGVKTADRGKIVVNDRLQTTVRNIYAIGDVTDIKQLAHFASAQGKAAAEIIAGHPSQTNWRAVPAATFTSPEIASVGLTEREARAEGRKLKIGRFPFRAHGRNIADGETTGFVKLIGDEETDQVLGAHIFGVRASELIHECSLAIAADLNIRDLAHAIHAHPTLTETLAEAAEDADGVAIHLMRQEARAAVR
ncbi:MAG TPA: dihydrolipoyl dehydrogenase [Candidatus Udaeobacter sp.]|jgi:dihydrolipoamide dehydrogenase|nr:dihydrolipoyl dehydrogenase [Candidatus Udaeobacter sp.]